MIVRARVSEAAIENFASAVTDVQNQSAMLSVGVDALAEMVLWIKDCKTEVEAHVEILNEAKLKTENKIVAYDKLVNQLFSEKERLERKIKWINAEMAITSKYVTEKDANGEEHLKANPRYKILEQRLTIAEGKLHEVMNHLFQAQEKLNKAKSVKYKLVSHLESLLGAQRDLGVSLNEIRALQVQLSEIKMHNERWTRAAMDKLKRIQDIIRNYAELQMKMEPQVTAPYEMVDSFYNDVTIVRGEKTFSYKDSHVLPDQVIPEANLGRLWKDDNGQVYRINNELVKNTVFQINGYMYKTDSQARTVQASGKLQLPAKRSRSLEKMDVIGKGDQLETDDRGHLIGHRFNGSDKLENLVPQDSQVNKGNYEKLESRLADIILEGHEVYVSVMPLYKDSRRPEAIFYYYSTDGYNSAVFFPNARSEEST